MRSHMSYPFHTPAEAYAWLWDHRIFQGNEISLQPSIMPWNQPHSLWEDGCVVIQPKIFNILTREFQETPDGNCEVWIEIETGPFIGYEDQYTYRKEYGTSVPYNLLSHDPDLDVLEPTLNEALLALARKVYDKYGE